MEQLTDVLTEVAVVLEVLRQRDQSVATGCGIAKVLAKIVDVDRVGSQSGQKR